MKKKHTTLIILLVLMLSIITYYYLNYSDIEASSEIKDNKGNSITYLSEEDGQSILKVFNFDQEKFTKKYKIKQEKDIYSSTYYNPKEKESVIITQQLEPSGYQVYLQNQNKINKIGFIKGGVKEVFINNNYLYALVYPSDSSQGAQLKKFNIKELEKPIMTWSLEGNPERMLIDYNSNKIYILTVTNKTLLYSLDNKTDQMNSKELLDKAYDLNASIEKGQLWLLLREKLGNQNEKTMRSEEIKSLFLYDLKKGELIKKISTKFQPKFIQLDSKQIYIISGTSNTSYLEIYNRDNIGEAEKVIKLKAAVINGFSNEKYIFSNKGIFKIQDGNVKLIREENISPYTDLIIH